jgi:hypothetical protein
MRQALLILCSACLPAAEAVIERTSTAMTIRLDGGVVCELALADGVVLGLRQAAVDGLSGIPGSILRFPVLREEWQSKPLVAHRFTLAACRPTAGGGAEIVLRLAATRDPRALAAVCVLQQDGTPLRDFYRQAHLRLPAEACRAQALADLARLPDDLPAAGTLTWTIEPARAVISGWTWRGWRERWDLRLDGWQVAGIAWLGGLGGGPGLTVANHRFRGLGGLEYDLTTDVAGRAIHPFTTTEIIPTKDLDMPVIAPAVPAPVVAGDRGWSLVHRQKAWICRLGRGAGVQSFDFAWSPAGGILSFPERQGDLRALTECHPGDTVLSHTDEERFALTATHATVPVLHLALPMAADRAAWRTRWQECDRFVRALHAAELGMQQPTVEPAIGFVMITRFGENLKRLTAWVDRWADAGVRQVILHGPGWLNGRSLRDGAQPSVPYHGGGDCVIYDWRPLDEARQPWTDFNAACVRRRVKEFAWLTAMSRAAGPFHQRVGADLGHWAINDPAMAVSSGYPPDLFNHNLHDASFVREFFPAIEQVRREQGFQGIWADSFQNLFMTAYDWKGGTGAPMQRAWWERVAAWDRQGVTWMSESTAAPGLSCTIECGPPDHEGEWWYLQYTTRWYRFDMPGAGTPAADRLAFRTLANGGWTTPMGHVGWFEPSGVTCLDPATIIPSFAVYAQVWTQAKPWMEASQVLPGELGVLWHRSADRSQGVWFAFSDAALPAGVTARDLLTGAPASVVRAHTAYAVTAADLLAAFDRPIPPTP